MVWTAPRTWTTSELVTAAFMNTHVRDNLNALVTVGWENDATDVTGITSTSFAAGAAVCGFAFVAPTASIWVTVGGVVQAVLSGNVTRRAELSWELRQGNSVGSGTVVVAADLVRSVSAEIGATSGLNVGVVASHRALVDGLTPGNDYNVQTMHRVSGTSVTGAFVDRSIAVEAAA